jgi:hypothetical protein
MELISVVFPQLPVELNKHIYEYGYWQNIHDSLAKWKEEHKMKFDTVLKELRIPVYVFQAEQHQKKDIWAWDRVRFHIRHFWGLKMDVKLSAESLWKKTENVWTTIPLDLSGEKDDRTFTAKFRICFEEGYCM